MKRRWLRILLVSLALLFVAGFGAFSTLLFNPFEGRFEYDLSSLIPREVDFYVSKADLRADLDPFPVPVFFRELQDDPSGQALLHLDQLTALDEKLQLELRIAELRRVLRSLPLRIDVLDVFGGQDLAVAGFFESGLEATQWVCLGRANWMGKAGVEALRYPGLLRLSERGLEVEEQGDVLALSGPALPQPVYLTRIRDVVVAASTPQLATRARELEAVRGENSFGLSAKYADHVSLLEREGDELEFFVDYRRLAASQSWNMALPDAYSDDLATAIAGRLFQVVMLRDLIGILGFDRGFFVRMTALVSSETMTAVQKRLYRERGFDKARMLELAKLVPADTGLFAYLHADLGDLLREALSASQESMVQLLDDRARVIWDMPDANALVTELEAAFRDRVALIVRDNDYPDEGEAGPPHNDVVVPAWAMVLWVDDRDKLEALRERVVARQGDLAIMGREPGSRGVFIKSVSGGYKAYEYWSQQVPGTGEIATMSMQTGGRDSDKESQDSRAEYFIVSNNWQMLGALVKTYYEGAPNYPRLADEVAFRSLVNTGLASANLLTWVNPRAVGETTRALAERTAREAAFIDWGTERPRIEREILAREFPGERYGSVSPEVQSQLDVLAGQAADALEAEVRGREVPRLRARLMRQLQALDLLSGLLVELSVDQKRFELFARGVVPFDGEPSSP